MLMKDIYTLSFSQTGSNLSYLAFPAEAGIKAEAIFKPKYSGLEFLAALEQSGKKMLDIIADYYFSGKAFQYEIDNGRLIIRVAAMSGSPDRGTIHLPGNAISAMMVMAMHVPNYEAVKKRTDAGKPVSVSGDYAEVMPPVYRGIGAETYAELLGMLRGSRSFSGEKVEIVPLMIPAN